MLRRFLLTLALSACFLPAQTMNTGTFLGTVKDSSGGGVPGATVRITREGTAFQRETLTDSEGNYRILDAPAGNYRLEFEKQGFRKVNRTGIAISAGQSLRVDAELPVGAVTETVQVNAQVAEVDTNTANVGSTVYGPQVQELALNTRSFTQLVNLEPGVASSQAQQPGFGSNTGVPFSFNGSQQSSNNWLLDGGRNIDPYNGNNLTIVNLDAIAEVRIERNAYSAEYGRNSGAQINVITRSGTNSYHGTLFEFFRNDHLDARNFFATAKPKNRYNNWGGTVGGPIKKDKLFFFLSNEYRRIWQTTGTRTSIVPTPAEIAGNFAGGRTITDPQTGQPFSGNIIPSGRLDPNAVALLKNYYAAPNYQQGALNFSSSAPDGTDYKSALARVDYNIRPNLTMFGRYNIDSTRLSSPFGLFASNPMPTVAASSEAHIMYAANASLNWTIRPNLLNEFTTAWYHGSMAITTLPFASRARVPDFNVPRIFNTPTDSGGLIPSINMAQGYAGISILWPQNISHYSYEALDNLAWIKGSHTFKFGVNLDKENKSQNNSSPNNNGTFTFNGSATGDALADLLLGQAFQYTENSAHVFGSLRFNDVGLYAQDQYRVNDRLTLTYGLRWEFFQPEQDEAGTMSFFLPSRFNFSQAAQVLPNGQIVPGTQNFGNGVVPVGPNSPYGNALTNTVHDVFDPRFGFSYSATKDNLTVIRGGYGIFHDRWSQFASSARNNYPFNQSVSIFNTSFSNPAQGTQRVFPIGLTNFNSPWEIPSLQKWSLGVQRQLPGSMVLDVSYVGSKGSHLLRTLDMNQPAPNAAVASGQLSANAVRPYPGFASINTYFTDGNSIYNSLQVSAVRRFAAGFSAQVSYTFSKELDDVSTPLNSYGNPNLERGLSSFDRTHVLVASYIWDVPVGHTLQGWRKKVLDGWQISGISSFQSGNPLTMTISPDRAGTGGGGERPDLIAPVERLMALSQWFSTSSFALPALGAFGDAGRSLVRGPGINDWDVSFSKRTSINERVALQFRAEFFNLFNHTQYSGVGTLYGSATFGQVVSARDPRITQLGLRLLF